MFQSTLPRGERPMPTISRRPSAGVSIHAPARGATRGRVSAWLDIYVSIHAPARGATMLLICLSSAVIVSIHAPARGATWRQQESHHRSLLFQSTLPRGERRASILRQRRRWRVSIHAPARGATKSAIDLLLEQLVSIHAPARGATGSGEAAGLLGHSFNPRSRAGSDLNLRQTCCTSLQFQSTLPRGERLEVIGVGCEGLQVSIHAPARGATKYKLCHPIPFGQFQSTLPRGERLALRERVRRSQIVSIHAPARGATRRSRSSSRRSRGFNPRSRAGSDGRAKLSSNRHSLFQSTLPRGERPWPRAHHSQ